MTEKLDPALRIDVDPEADAGTLPALSSNVPKPRRGGGPRNPAKRRDVALRVDEIIRLRVMGKTWNEVAKAVGYTKREAAIRALRTYLQGLPAENARELRAIENERYDRLTEKLWPACMQLDYDAIDRALRISQHRRAMNGIDLEPKLLLDPPSNGDADAAADERLAELRKHLEGATFEEKQAVLAQLLRFRLLGAPPRPSS